MAKRNGLLKVEESDTTDNELEQGGLAMTADASGENVYTIAMLNAYPKGGATLDRQDLNLSEHVVTLILMKISKNRKASLAQKSPSSYRRVKRRHVARCRREYLPLRQHHVNSIIGWEKNNV